MGRKTSVKDPNPWPANVVNQEFLIQSSKMTAFCLKAPRVNKFLHRVKGCKWGLRRMACQKVTRSLFTCHDLEFCMKSG